MRWKQFFMPAKSMNAEESRQFLAGKTSAEVNILDVRQISEYESGHLPGAKLIPLPDLGDRLDELDPSKPTVVY
jgi:rhodanese-related sulfurtransferase